MKRAFNRANGEQSIDWFLELDVTVTGDFNPGERQTRDHPGELSHVSDVQIFLGDLDITKYLDTSQIEMAAEQLLETCLED